MLGREGAEVIDIPDAALRHGFSNARSGVVTSRTLMLADLQRLLDALAPIASVEDVRSAVVDDNVLRKPTDATRRKSFHYSVDRFILDPRVTMFRALQLMWPMDAASQPLLAMLIASSRDPLIRASTEAVLGTEIGALVLPDNLSRTVRDAFPGQYTEKTLKSTGENLASTWQQSGHLAGRAKKRRARPECRPVAVAYALLLGYLCGVRGNALFDTFWTSLLDAPSLEVREQAAEASQLGWIEYRQAGGVTEVGFDYLLRNHAAGDGRR